MTETLVWQIGLVLCLITIGTMCILLSASLPRYCRIIRSNLVNYFLFLSLSSTTITALSSIFKKQAPPYFVAGFAIATFTAMIFTIVWMVPSKDSTRSYSEAPRTQFLKSVFFKFVYSAILFGMPVILGIHVYKYGESYLANLRAYQEFIVKTSPPGQAALVLEPASAPVKYAQAIDLHFLSNTKLQCAQSVSDCVKIQNLLNRSQNNRPLFLAKLLFYFVCLYLVFRFYGVLVEVRYKRKPRIPGDLGLQSDVVEQCTQIIAVSAALLLALIIAGVDFSSLGIFAGLLAAGLSVAMKDVLGNVVAGVLLLWGKTIKANDVITIPRSESSDTGATYGVVRRMTMRYTVVEDRNEVRRLIPNSKLTDNTIENWTHEDRSVRLRVLVDVDYHTDLRQARTLLESVCYEVPKIDTKKQPPKAVVIGFGESAIHMSLRFWVNEPHKGIRPILSDVYIAIAERFEEEGIKIPYPQRELHMTTAEPTKGAPQGGIPDKKGREPRVDKR
jgi:small-conductance mechanosensitive channel